MDMYTGSDNTALSNIKWIFIILIAVILSAVLLGSYVLTTSRSPDPRPQVKWGFEQEGSPGEKGAVIKITHVGGDTVENNPPRRDLDVLVVGKGSKAGVEQFSQTRIKQGDSVVIDISGTDNTGSINVEKGDIVKLRWVSINGEEFILDDYKIRSSG